MKKWTKLEIEALVLNYEGVHARDLAIEVGRTPLAIRLKARKLGLKSKLKNKGNGLDHKGPNNPMWGRNGLKGENNPCWKGDKAGVEAIHKWIRQNKPKPKRCENCNKLKKLTLANIKNHNYTRNIEDYKWFCEGCHRKMDTSKIWDIIIKPYKETA